MNGLRRLVAPLLLASCLAASGKGEEKAGPFAGWDEARIEAHRKKSRTAIGARLIKWLNARKAMVRVCSRCDGDGRVGRNERCGKCGGRMARVSENNVRRAHWELRSPAFRSDSDREKKFERLLLDALVRVSTARIRLNQISSCKRGKILVLGNHALADYEAKGGPGETESRIEWIEVHGKWWIADEDADAFVTRWDYPGTGSPPPAAGTTELPLPGPGAREWNQAGANPCRTGVVDVEPIRSGPRVAWRYEPRGSLLAGPVSWGGTVYAVTGSPSARKLVALDAAKGTVRSERPAGKGAGPAMLSLTVWDGLCVLTEPGMMQAIRPVGRKPTAWRIREEWAGPPCVYRGHLFASGGGRIHAVEMATGRGSHVGCRSAGMVALRPGTGWPTSIACPRHYTDDYFGLNPLHLQQAALRGWSIGRPMPLNAVPALVGDMVSPAIETDRWGSTVVRLPGSWLVSCPAGLRSKPVTLPGAIVPDGADRSSAMSMIATAPAVAEGLAWGFSHRDTLLLMHPDGRYAEVLKTNEVPPGAAVGPASAARGVLTFGNWAFDAAKRKPLWCLPGVRPATPAIPAGDRLLVVGTKEGHLLGIAGGD